MATRRYSFGLAGQKFDFELPAIGEGESEETKSVLASYFPELRLRYGAKTQRGGRLGRDVTPVEKEVSLAPRMGGGGAVVNITGPTATQTITQAQPTAAPAAPAPAPAPAAYTGPDYTKYFEEILGAVKPKETTETKPEETATTTPTTPTGTTPTTPAAKQFTGNIGGISYQKLSGEKLGAADVQAAIKAGYDPASVFGYAASLPKGELGKTVREDIKEAGFTLSSKGAFGGTLPSTPTAAQTFLDTAVSKQISKGAEKQVNAAVTRAQGISVAAASPTAQPTTIASPFTYVAPPAAPAAPAAAAASISPAARAASNSIAAVMAASSGGGRGGKGK